MDSILRTVACMALAIFTTGAHAGTLPGPDAINGAFARLLARDSGTVSQLPVRGEPDSVALLIADALRVQRAGTRPMSNAPLSSIRPPHPGDDASTVLR